MDSITCEYMIVEVESDYATDLSDEVNKHIKNGWMPQGGLVVIPGDVVNRRNMTFYQAMNRYGIK